MDDKVTVFSFVNEITYGKQNIFNDETKDQYIPFIVNRALSYFPDCILYSNDLNMYPDLPKAFQNGHYLNSISKRKRFSKWAKKLDDESISLITDLYQCNERKAAEILSVLTPTELNSLQQLKTGSGNEQRKRKQR